MSLPADYRIRLMQAADDAAIAAISRVVYPHDVPYMPPFLTRTTLGGGGSIPFQGAS